MAITQSHLAWFKLKCPYPTNSQAYKQAYAKLNNATYADLEKLRAEFDEAYRFGEVSALATFPYLRILFAIGAGYFVFAEIATPRELIGVAIIVICGLLANEKRHPAVP